MGKEYTPFKCEVAEGGGHLGAEVHLGFGQVVLLEDEAEGEEDVVPVSGADELRLPGEGRPVGELVDVHGALLVVGQEASHLLRVRRDVHVAAKLHVLGAQAFLDVLVVVLVLHQLGQNVVVNDVEVAEVELDHVGHVLNREPVLGEPLEER